MVGGGPGAFIGPVHLMAARLDGEAVLVCGAFSSDPARSAAHGQALGLDPSRCYGSYEAMLAAESRRGDDRMQAVVIVTPNHLHFPIGRAALEAGFHVLSDKPATATHAEAVELLAAADRSGLIYALTYTYSGYPMVRQARALCRDGALGPIRKVVAEYSQGWLGRALERDGSRQAAWRTDPQSAGAGGCVADIGVHAFHLLEFVTGRRVDRVAADAARLVDGRRLDDDCNILLRLDNGAPGLIFTSQVAAGERNGLRLRVYGEAGGLAWSQEIPDRLHVMTGDGPTQTYFAGADRSELAPAARRATRLPAGHPEGYIEAFANLYGDFAAAVRRHESGAAPEDDMLPLLAEGVRGMRFIEAVVANAARVDHWDTI